MLKIRRYTAEEKAFIKDNIKGKSYVELTFMFNQEFSHPITIANMKSFWANNKLKSGTGGFFRKGNIPANKGTKGLTGSNKTSFKKGSKPHNYRSVGSERITKDGYTEVKVAEPKKWRLKHLVIWEAENGPVPKGKVIMFADKDKTNFNLNNLILISKAEHLVINRWNLSSENQSLTKTGILVANVILKIATRKKGNKK